MTGKGHKGRFWLDGKVLDLDCGGGCMGVYICKSLQTVKWAKLSHKKVDLKQKTYSIQLFSPPTVD